MFRADESRGISAMKKIAEMELTEYFKLSTGDIALVGLMDPDLDEVLTKCKAYLYIDDKKIRSINIIGEDQFKRVNGKIRKNRRSVRTLDDVYDDLKSSGDKQIKLIFYTE